MRGWCAVLWLCASACDYVFVIEPDPVAVCGPFGEPRALAIDASLEEPQFFSARNTNAGVAVGAVYARRAGVRRVWILQQADELTWNLASGTANSILLDNTLGASIGEIEFPTVMDPMGIDRLVVWRGMPVRPFEAKLITQGYTIDAAPMVVDSQFDIMVGNLVEVLDTAPNGDKSPQRKRTVVTKVPKDGVSKPALVFADRIAPYDDEHLWAEDANRTAPINTDLKAVPGRGVITSDTFILVYSVKYANGSYDIYASRRDDTTKLWNLGRPVGGKVNTSGDEVDPWINGDCSTLYFSRDGVIYRSDRVDE